MKNAVNELGTMNEEELKNFIYFLLGAISFAEEYSNTHLPFSLDNVFTYYYDSYLKSLKE
jgi:hypothetical protein